MTVNLAMYKGKGLIGNAIIRWWTSSPYSHCELVIDGLCYSSSMMDKGVRCKKINLEDGKWDLIVLPFADSQCVIDYFHTTNNQRYGWFGLIRSQLFNRNRTVTDAQFCSEWCANALSMPNAPSYSPASLENICKWVNTLRM